MNRGVLFSLDIGNRGDHLPVVASGRDVGNFGAGYIAGNHSLINWGMARFGFDLLQTRQDRGFKTGKWSTEGQTSQQAQRVGYSVGRQIWYNRMDKLFRPMRTLRGPKY